MPGGYSPLMCIRLHFRVKQQELEVKSERNPTLPSLGFSGVVSEQVLFPPEGGAGCCNLSFWNDM